MMDERPFDKLRAGWTTGADGSQESPAEDVERFWTLGEEFGELRFSIEGPRVSEAILKRLGSLPLPQEGELLRAELGRLYRTLSERAIRSACEDEV